MPRVVKSVEREKDQFFTNESTADDCVTFLETVIGITDYNGTILEPSVGKRQFVKSIKSIDSHIPITCFDIDFFNTDDSDDSDDSVSFEQCDFLTTIRGENGPYMAIGNPPYGKCSSLAVKFINHCAREWECEYIAFILPLTFEKPSVAERIDRHYHLVDKLLIAPNSFIFEGKQYNVPAAFYIFERRSTLREIPAKKQCDSNVFKFLSCENYQQALFMVQRVGARAGAVTFSKLKIEEKALAKSKSYYFIGINKSELSKGQLQLLETFCAEDLTSKKLTAGMPSISKPELFEHFEKTVINPRA